MYFGNQDNIRLTIGISSTYVGSGELISAQLSRDHDANGCLVREAQHVVHFLRKKMYSL